jgi:hypothetical protein
MINVATVTNKMKVLGSEGIFKLMCNVENGKKES